MAKERKTPMIYAHLEGRPVVILDVDKGIGYWLIDGKWRKMHPADTTQAGLMDKADFDRAYPNLPPLP